MKAAALLRLSARSVGRNARRSALTASAMALGLALLIFTRALADGGHEQWIRSAVRLGTGHIAIQAPEYLETGDLKHHLDEEVTRRVLEAVKDPEVARRTVMSTQRLTVTGLASSAAAAIPARIEGVDPESEAAFSQLTEKLTDGRYLKTGDRLRAVIGSEMARRLELKVGSRFVLTAQGADGEVTGQLVRVAGIFSTGIEEMDQGLVHIPLSTARSWLAAPGAVTTVAVLLRSSRDTKPALRALRRRLADDSGIRVLGWREASPELDSAVRIDDWGDYIFHGVLFAIVMLAILNSIMMSVLGRTREFGILQALGLTGAETGWVVFGEGFFLTAASGVVGMIAGFLFTWGFFRDGLDFSRFMDSSMSISGAIIDPVIIPEFHFSQIALSALSIAVVGTLASLYPAYRAARIEAAEAMKFEE
ncbi:MAG: ABC transporter permease [Gemmatimonadota bacterium]